MSIFKIIPIFIFASLVTSCSHKEDHGKLSQLDLPSWVIDQNVDGKMASVGISPATQGGIKMQIAQAEADAQANMAAQIQTIVSRVTKDAMRKAAVGKQENTDQYFAQATENIVKNVPLSGAVRDHIYAGVDGTLYIHMIIDQSGVKNYLQSSVDTFAPAMKEMGMSQKAIEDTEKSMSGLFAQIDMSKSNTQDSLKPANAESVPTNQTPAQ